MEEHVSKFWMVRDGHLTQCAIEKIFRKNTSRFVDTCYRWIYLLYNAKDDAIANDHEAHITPDGPADERSNDEQSNAESNYAIANDREAHIAPKGPAEGRRLQ